MPGAHCTRSLAWEKQKPHERSRHGRTGITRHSRTRMVLTVSFALSSETGLSCLRRRRIIIRQLDASVGASGPHDFAVRRLHPSSSRCICVHRIPLPTSVTIAKRPSSGNRMAGDMDVIWGRREAKYFLGEDWTGSISLIWFDKFAFRRTGCCACYQPKPDRGTLARFKRPPASEFS
jgi:hypothetical protein